MKPTIATRPRPRPIAVLMKAEGITLFALADAVGCSTQWLGLVVNGHREPSRRLRASLSLALGVPADDLF